MSTLFATGVSENTESFAAGEEVATATLHKLNGRRPNVAIIFASVNYDLNKLLEGVRKVIGQIPLIGCSAAGEFSEEKVSKNGVACALIATDTHQFFAGIGENIKQDEIKAILSATKDFPLEIAGYPYRSAMLLIDGLAGKGEEAVLAAFSVLGPNVKFSGGAAGDDLKFKKTYVFGNNHAISNALSMCLVASQNPIFIAVKHGHVPFTPPLRVTKAKGNVLYEIEGKPAIEVWKTYIKEKAINEDGIDVDQITNPEELSKLLLKYEAGLMTGQEYKLRFPASANPDGSLNFVCSIVEGSVIKIMDSKDTNQIASARAAAESALHAAQGAKITGAVIFDCACRGMILKDKFSNAVDEIKKVLGKIPIIGCETYGEIAMEIGQLSGFHNTTTVIMLLSA
jgi:hypothetical protein